MFSLAKHFDRQTLLDLAGIIELLVKLGNTELAEEVGETYLALEKKIATYDYTKDDELLELVNHSKNL